MSRSRSRSLASDSRNPHNNPHERLEPRLLRACETDDLASLTHVIDLARRNGQFSEGFRRVGLMRSCERGSVAATEFLLRVGASTTTRTIAPAATNTNTNTDATAKTDTNANVTANANPKTATTTTTTTTITTTPLPLPPQSQSQSQSQSQPQPQHQGQPSPFPSPLLRAVEHNHARIVQLLLTHNFSPETADKKGRTALMTAAWRNHFHVLQVLVARGADVNARDARGRNVLHNLAADKVCEWGEDVVGLLLAGRNGYGYGNGNGGNNGGNGVDLDARDVLGRTPLHWACATGKLRLAEMLLVRMMQMQMPNQDYYRDHAKGEREHDYGVNAVESRNKTALHIAVAHGQAREDLVQLLLRHGADVNARSDGGWTPLHNACDKGAEAMVRLLLRHGARVNAQLLNGITPLHLAAQAGHREVVEVLLERGDVKRRVRDNFGSTPFLRAAQFKRRDVVALLAPFNNVGALSEDARGACEAFEATVVDFGNFHNENRVKRTSVYDLLYGRDGENPRKQAFSTLPANVKATDFRWIHLPANNMAWVEALLTKSFIEEGAHDVDSFKGLEKSFRYRHGGQRTHSHFMRPMCLCTPRAPRSREDESDEKKRQMQAASRLPDQDDGSSPHAKRGKAATQTTKKGPKPAPPKGRRDEKLHSPLSLCKDPGHSAAHNVCVFMPYLHFETAQGRQKMQEAIQSAERKQRVNPNPRDEHPPQPGIKRSPTRDEMLIRAHLASSTTSLHIRRTLDQFFYPNIDTQTRDQDQVVFRYQTKGQGRDRVYPEPKIFMVDQLWMWILGTNLIVTSFPQRWEQPKNDPLNVLDGIIEDINSKTREPVRSVYDLATIITNRCSGVFDRHRMGDEEYQFLDMFESSIGVATDRETRLFNLFNRASAQASDWLKNHRKLSRAAQRDLNKKKTPDRRFFDDQHEIEEEPLFVDNLLDIGQETDLLAEAKDIRDELNMIRTVLEHQQNVLDDFQDVICGIYLDEHRSQVEVKKRFKEQQRTIDMHLKDIERMDKQAERIYESITDLLDLKQKHANAFEARFARDQAAGTTRQGKIILVFTIVTIVFLPLSFITSFFTINLDEFQRNGLALPYVAKYTFGIGFAISIPLILLALSVDDIGDGCREGVRRLRGLLVKRGREPLQTEDRLRSGLLDMERGLSSARGRRSVDTEFGGGLLPMSTRETAPSMSMGNRRSFGVKREDLY